MCVNKKIPGRTVKEYKKEYYIANKEKINERHKAHYIDNKDQILEQQKAYDDANKDKLKEKFHCQCGGCYTHHNKSIHQKTAKHQKFINNL